MANHSKLIRLTPLRDFFFGGENTFGQDNTNYYVKSNYFPQQTSLLGMLRYELLKSDPEAFDLAKDKVIHQGNAENLIGKSGFSLLYDFNYGIIEGISPVFLVDAEGAAWFIGGNPCLEKPSAAKVKLVPFAHSSGYDLLKGGKVSGLQLQCGNAPWNGKDDFVPYLAGPDNKTIPLSDVFYPVKKTNNRKEYEGNTDDSGFFKQEFWRLESGWSFAFLAAFNRELPELFGNRRQVHLGAERRFFSLELSDLSVHQQYSGIIFNNNYFDGFEKLYQGAPLPAELTDDQIKQLVALAPLFIHHVVSDGWNFARIIKIWHRFLQTHLKNPNEVFKSGSNAKSALFSLADRGSSIWFNNTAAIEAELSDNGAARRIGYNYFKTL